MNIILPNSGNIFPNIQQKILNLVHISDKNDKEDNKKLFYLEHMNTDNLLLFVIFKAKKICLKYIINLKKKKVLINLWK